MTVVALATLSRSAVFVVAGTEAKVCKSAQVELSAECCTLHTVAPFIVFAVTWSVAKPPLAELAALSTDVPVVVVVIAASSARDIALPTPNRS